MAVELWGGCVCAFGVWIGEHPEEEAVGVHISAMSTLCR